MAPIQPEEVEGLLKSGILEGQYEKLWSYLPMKNFSEKAEKNWASAQKNPSVLYSKATERRYELFKK